jgi:hypothetical protein
MGRFPSLDALKNAMRSWRDDASAKNAEVVPSLSALSLPHADGEMKRLGKRKRILRYARRAGVGLELGVFRGLFSEALAQELQPRTFYLVDPWTKLGERFPWRPDSPLTLEGKLTTAGALDDAKKKLARFPNVNARFIEDYSIHFLTDTTETFDWIYIDTTHRYVDTIKELRLAAQRLHPDGVIMGDDWQPDPSDRHHGVFVAINQFIKETDFVLVSAGLALQWCIRRATAREISDMQEGPRKN